MIYSVRGTLTYMEAGFAVVECGGVGYKCLTSMNTLGKLPTAGSEVTLYTYLSVREDAVDLFGFIDNEELACFRMLTTVSGVGPKVGLAILSILTPDKVALAIAGEDSKILTNAAGVGPKLAKRIVLELKDKMKGVGFHFVEEGEAVNAALSGGNASEAVAALSVLGFSQSEAASAVARLDSELPVQDMVKAALKSLSGGK